MSWQTSVIAMYDSGMLDSFIGKKEPSADRTNSFHLHVTNHLTKPAWIDQFRVIVEKKHIVGRYIIQRPVHQSREKIPFVIRNAHDTASRVQHESCQVRQCFDVVRFVVDYQYFVIPVSRERQ